MSTKIYFIGSAPKSDEALKNFQDWRIPYLQSIKKELPDVEMLDFNDVDESIGPYNLFGHDCHLIKNAHVVVANAESKIGAGTAMEMLIAKYFQKPLITVLPKDTYHRRSNVTSGGKNIKDWIHPFIFCVSDEIVEVATVIAELIKKYIQNNKSPVKDITIINQAIEKYQNFIHN
ncbi:MAG: hypothetical protein Q8Q23_00060 [bacterium]|nr:hypothetical protein [bacterium]